MPQPESMAKLMRSLFEQALAQDILARRHSVEFIVQARGRNNRAVALELSLAEDEREHRDVKVTIGDAEHTCPAIRTLLETLQDRGGVMLAAPVIPGECQIQLLRPDAARRAE